MRFWNTRGGRVVVRKPKSTDLIRSVVERLECRAMLSVTWSNQSSGSNGFNSSFGTTNAALAKQIVLRAVADWNNVFAGTANVALNITAADLSGTSPTARASTVVTAVNASKTPTAATIVLDNDGAGTNWYFDPQVWSTTGGTPDDSEFTALLNAFAASGSGSVAAGSDLYRTITHEIGHALGIIQTWTHGSSGGNTKLGDSLAGGKIGTDYFDSSASVYQVGYGGSNIIYLTDSGGLHLYEGSPGDPPSYNPAYETKDDLMNSGRTAPPGLRELISEKDALLLASVYGYSYLSAGMNTVNTFLSNYNTQSHVLTTNAIPTTGPGGSIIRAFIPSINNMTSCVNTYTESFTGVTAITINGSGGDDIVYLDSGVGFGLPFSVSIQMDGKAGNDVLQGGKMNDTILGGDGNDSIRGSDGGDSLSGENGNDTIVGETGADTIFGDSGDDLLDAGDRLATGPFAVFADSVSGGLNNDTIYGDAGQDTMTGGDGDDVIIHGGSILGGTGRDLLIGPEGAQSVNGGDDDDIVISGDTSYRINLPALAAIMGVWTNTAISYPTRVSQITTGVSYGGGLTAKLDSTTVHDDASIDTLAGGNGTDWFFGRNTGGTADLFSDKLVTETLTVI